MRESRQVKAMGKYVCSREIAYNICMFEERRRGGDVKSTGFPQGV
jgi:hypothetical protein